MIYYLLLRFLLINPRLHCTASNVMTTSFLWSIRRLAKVYASSIAQLLSAISLKAAAQEDGVRTELQMRGHKLLDRWVQAYRNLILAVKEAKNSDSNID